MNYPVGDYDVLERVLAKMIMTHPAEHAEGVQALMKIRRHAMATGDEEGIGLYITQLEDAVHDLTEAANEDRAELAYLRQCSTMASPCLAWADIGDDMQEAWRAYAHTATEEAAA